MTHPKPLDRQIAEERARHPTAGRAARDGARFGLSIGIFTGGVAVALDVIGGFLPTGLTPRLSGSWPGLLFGFMLGLVFSVLLSVAMAVLAAAVIRWWRRAAVRSWYPDRAA